MAASRGSAESRPDPGDPGALCKLLPRATAQQVPKVFFCDQLLSYKMEMLISSHLFMTA